MQMAPLRTIRDLSELTPGEVACLRADPATGKLVNSNGEWVSTKQTEIPVFARVEDAKNFAETELATSRSHIEYQVFDAAGRSLWLRR